MGKTAPTIGLLDLMQDFMAIKEEELSQELGEKYGVPPEEVADPFLVDEETGERPLSITY